MHQCNQSLPRLSSIKIKEVVDEEEKVVFNAKNVEYNDFYTIEEMKSMDNPTMSKMENKFSNIRFRRNKSLKPIIQSLTPNKRFTSRAGSSETNGGY